MEVPHFSPVASVHTYAGPTSTSLIQRSTDGEPGSVMEIFPLIGTGGSATACGSTSESGVQRLEDGLLASPVTEEHSRAFRRRYLPQATRSSAVRVKSRSSASTSSTLRSARRPLRSAGAGEGEHEQVATVTDREFDGFHRRLGPSPQPRPPVRAPAVRAASVDLDFGGREVEVTAKNQPQQPARQSRGRLTSSNVDMLPLLRRQYTVQGGLVFRELTMLAIQISQPPSSNPRSISWAPAPRWCDTALSREGLSLDVAKWPEACRRLRASSDSVRRD